MEISALDRHAYENPDRFVAGLVGERGHRVYYLQSRKGSRVTNVVCQPQQLVSLSDHIDAVLDKLDEYGLIDQMPILRKTPHDTRPLDVPLEADFMAGTMAISWQPQNQYLQVELFEYGHFDDANHGAASVLRAFITLDQARDFAARVRSIVDLGTPVCPFCAQPISPDGHVCPSANGFRRLTKI